MSLVQHEIEHDLLGLSVKQALSGTWASRPDPAGRVGERFTATDLAELPVDLVSDGTAWRPPSGALTLFLMSWSYGIAPSGAIAAGSAGALTLSAVFQHVYSEGIWLYLGATTGAAPALQAGWYWVVMSSTTVGTIYGAGPGSAPITFSAPGSFTGVTTATKIPFTYTVKAGLMPPKGLLEISGMVLQSNGAGAKLGTVYFGGQLSLATSNGSFYRRNLKGQITNKGVPNKQVASSWVADAGTSMSIGTNVDTTHDVLIEFELKTPESAQYVIFDHLRCTLIA